MKIPNEIRETLLEALVYLESREEPDDPTEVQAEERRLLAAETWLRGEQMPPRFWD